MAKLVPSLLLSLPLISSSRPFLSSFSFPCSPPPLSSYSLSPPPLSSPLSPLVLLLHCSPPPISPFPPFSLHFPSSCSDNRYLHSTTFLGPLLLSFGGCQDKQDCFSSDLLVYHTLCGTWQKLDTPGLPANASRFAHSSVLDPVDGSLLVFGGFVGTLRADMLRLVSSNCSRWINQEDCLRIAGPLCAWRKQEGKCVAISKADGEDVTYSCPIGMCVCECVCLERGEGGSVWDMCVVHRLHMM